MRRAAWIFTVVALSLTAIGATEVGVNSLLKYLPELEIDIESPSDSEMKCNITKGGLDAAMRIPLDSSRVRVLASDPQLSNAAKLRVDTLVLAETNVDFCTGSVELALYRLVSIADSDVAAFAPVWSAKAVISGSPHDFGKRVNDMVRELTGQFLGAWIKANPKPEAAPN